jgi:hypothetical protein
MKQLHALGAIGALCTMTVVSAESISIDLGTFSNDSTGGAYTYSGEYGSFVSSQTQFFDYLHTVIVVDLAGVLQSVGANAIVSVKVADSGANTYGPLSPGADIDWIGFDGLNGGSAAFAYSGPNAMHAAESAATIAQRIAAVDSFIGAQDVWHGVHTSLGNQGSITAAMSDGSNNAYALLHNGQLGGLTAAKLFVSEAGSSESFKITMEAMSIEVPAPAGLAILAGLGLAGRRRRR